MSVRVVVALLSGRQAAIEAELEMRVDELIQIAERKFRAQFYLQTLNSNFSTLGDFYSNMVQAVGAAVRVFELCERKPRSPDMDGCWDEAQERAWKGAGALQLRDLHFSYPARPDVKILSGLSLDVAASTVVALVGPSGNGKSTVISLLKRLYHVEEGSITLDGIPIWNFSHEQFHRVVSIVGQEPVLFARTIRENIVLGLENPEKIGGEDLPATGGTSLSFREIEDLATKANAHDFISKMPKGYATEVGERGVQLSGGQKQRIAIARSLARRPKVLLLDEATSALDAESELQVQRAIDSMIAEGSMTVIIIAHRLSTVKNSDKICVIKGGQAVLTASLVNDYLRLQALVRAYTDRYGPLVEGRDWHMDKTLAAAVLPPGPDVACHTQRTVLESLCEDGLSEAASRIGELREFPPAMNPRDVKVESPDGNPNLLPPVGATPAASSSAAPPSSGMADTLSKTIASIEDSMNLPSWLRQIRH